MDNQVVRMPLVCPSPDGRTPAPATVGPKGRSGVGLASCTPTDSTSDDGDDERGDEDNKGVSDPFLDDLLDSVATDDSVLENDDDGEALNDGLPNHIIEPRDLDLDDADPSPLVVPMDILVGEADSTSPMDDDEPALKFDVPLIETDTPLDRFDDGGDEGPLEAPMTLEDAAIHRPLDGDGNDDEVSVDPIGLYVDDDALPWAKERWPERPLSQAFTARRHLALVGSHLCAAGDSTNILDTRRCAVLTTLQTKAKTARAVPLDSECRKLLILSALGQLYTYKRNATESGTDSLQLASSRMVAGLWQLAPGVPKVLVRQESGHLEDFDSPSVRLAVPAPIEPTATLLAMSELGEPRVSLFRERGQLRLTVEADSSRVVVPVNAAIRRAASEARPILVGFNDLVLFGARDHGLWLFRQGQAEFSPLPGCRSLTAITVGHVGGRPYAFVGLFSELEDRAEIAQVDLSNGRAQRIAEFNVHSDCTGPEDDPPELTRIDSLVWDQSNQCLWVAGPFGVTRFAHPSDGTTC